jgi:hypothetical protein
MIDIAQEKIED